MVDFETSTGYPWAAGYFLADDESYTAVTHMVPKSSSIYVQHGDRLVVPAGTVIPSNDAYAVGILYEDIDVTEGSAYGSVVTHGIVYSGRLPETVESAAASAMGGIEFVSDSNTVRPDYFSKRWVALTVNSVAGTAAGDTSVTVGGYTLKSGESFKYIVGDSAAKITLGDTVSSSWSTYASGTDITAASGKIITVAAVSAGGYVFGAGSATVVAKA